MAAHRIVEIMKAAAVISLIGAIACSPEATRSRDGGPGADIGNKDAVQQTGPDPRAADTTMMPGKAPAPVSRFEKSKGSESFEK
jgi:hypothetical protein